MEVCFWPGQEQTRPVAGQRLLSRFIFAMKFSRATRAKNLTASTREHFRTDVRTPHVSPAPARLPPLLAFASGPCRKLAFPRANARRWFGLMRYRSATVAGFHGLSRCPKCDRKERTHSKRREPGHAMRFTGHLLTNPAHNFLSMLQIIASVFSDMLLAKPLGALQRSRP